MIPWIWICCDNFIHSHGQHIVGCLIEIKRFKFHSMRNLTPILIQQSPTCWLRELLTATQIQIQIRNSICSYTSTSYWYLFYPNVGGTFDLSELLLPCNYEGCIIKRWVVHLALYHCIMFLVWTEHQFSNVLGNIVLKLQIMIVSVAHPKGA